MAARRLLVVGLTAAAVLLLAVTQIPEIAAEDSMGERAPRYAFAIHGGAGSEDKEAAYQAKLAEALAAGEKVLAEGGAALDAVVAAITLMEDSPLFNAGKGAVFTADGKNELDSSIMDGATLNAGAVSGVTNVKNPILLARAVMDRSKHVMLQGKGAETFAAENGLEIVDPEYFYTERRWQQLQKAKEQKTGAILDHDLEFLDPDDLPDDLDDHKFGTVGAVALDRHGNLAAGTSTGGMTNKSWGRVGDSPIIGAGTYASNTSCAVSATGSGEYFIRATVARSVCALMEYGNLPLDVAADRIIMQQLGEMGGDGGIISLDRDGNIALVFNTKGMYRASVREGEEPVIGIYQE
jgi:beta-aspartyl-peptidase (threonine type)